MSVLAQELVGSPKDLDLGLEFTDSPFRSRELCALGGGDPGDFSAVDAILADPTMERSRADTQLRRGRGDRPA